MLLRFGPTGCRATDEGESTRRAYAGLSRREVAMRDFVSWRHSQGKYIAFSMQCKVVRGEDSKIEIENFDLSRLFRASSGKILIRRRWFGQRKVDGDGWVVGDAVGGGGV